MVRSALYAALSFTLSLNLAVADGIRPVSAQALDPELFGEPEQTIVLLTSLNERTIPLFMRPLVASVMSPTRLESHFRGHFANRGFRLKVVHHADSHALWTAVRDPSTVGVFWISHASAMWSSESGGLGSDGGLVDFQSLDVFRSLEGIHPNLRYLGVVGCKGQEALEHLLTEKGIMARNPQLVFRSYERTVNPREGLLELMGESDAVLNRPDVMAGYESGCPVERGFGLRITRTVGDGVDRTTGRYNERLLPALRIETRYRLLGVFPQAWDGATQQMTVNVPVGEEGQNPIVVFKVMGSAGDNYWLPNRPLELGNLRIEASWEGARWQPHLASNGEPSGTSFNSYLYRGPRVPGIAPEEFRNWACQPMPARVIPSSDPAPSRRERRRARRAAR